MKISIKKELETYCELHWWNMGKKTLSFKGELKDLLNSYDIKFTKRKTETEGIYTFHFKSIHGISFKKRDLIYNFTDLAKRVIQMELVRMGDKSQLYVEGTFRSTVTINK